MQNIRAIVTETGAGVEIARLIHGTSKQSVEIRTRYQLRHIIEQVVRDNPRATCDDMDDALRRGYWSTDLGSEEFSVFVLEPVEVDQVE